MSILTVTVYQINGKPIVGGCEKQLACGKVKSIQQNVKLPLYAGAPLTCDEDAPEDAITEIIELPNGDRWWIEYNGTPFHEQCIAAGGSGGGGGGAVTLQLNADGNWPVPDGILVDKIAMLPTVGSNQQIGTSPGGDELMLDQFLAADTWKTVTVDVIGGIIYFQGIAGPQTIKIYTKAL